MIKSSQYPEAHISYYLTVDFELRIQVTEFKASRKDVFLAFELRIIFLLFISLHPFVKSSISVVMLIRMFVDIILDSNRHNFVEVTKSENFATLELFHHALFKDILAALG